MGYMVYTGTIEALKVSNDGITKAFNERIEGLNDILKGKDELLNEYRQRLGILPPPDNPYFRLTDEELKKEVEGEHCQERHEAVNPGLLRVGDVERGERQDQGS